MPKRRLRWLIASHAADLETLSMDFATNAGQMMNCVGITRKKGTKMAPRKTATKKNTTSTTEESVKTTVETMAETPKKAASVNKTVSCAPHPAVNVRKEPKADAEVVGEFKNGEKIECEKPVGGWAKTDKGYVMSKFLV